MALRLKVPGKVGEWDSELLIPPTVENATLRITLRLALRAHSFETFELDKRDDNGDRIPGEKEIIDTRPWTQREWLTFYFGVQRLCEQYWNNVFWLEVPANYAELDVPFSPLHGTFDGVFRSRPTHRPNVKCEFKLKLVGAMCAASGSAAGNPHRTVTVLRLDEGQTAIRQSARLWDHTVIDWRWTAEDGTIYKQIPVVHEVGHLLNLFHPGVGVVAGCTRTRNSQPECYCVDGWCAELLGAGMEITNRLAWPWQESMQNHTGVDAKMWRVLRVSRPPKLIEVAKSLATGTVNLGIAGQALFR